MMVGFSNTTLSRSDNNSIDYSCLMTPAFRNVQLTSSVILFVMTTFGNSLVLASLLKFKKKFKGSLFIFIGNLAAADLIIGLSMLLFIAEEIEPALFDIWHFCMAKTIIFILPFIASMLFMLCISIDRYMAVMFPFKHRLKSTKKKMFIVFCISVWTLCVVLSTGLIYSPRSNFDGDAIVCRIGAIIPGIHSLIASSAIILVIIVNIILYVVVVRKIQTKELPGGNGTNRNVIKTRLMITVFTLFIIFYLPFLICTLLMHTTPSIRQDMICAKEYVAMIARVNSTLNWIVYGLDNKKFRTAFKSLLSCNNCVSKKSSSSIPSISKVFNDCSSENVVGQI